MIEVYEDTNIDFTSLNMLSTMQLQEIAETICADALERARPPATRSKDKRSLKELLQDPTFLQRFKVGLAKGLVNLLAAHDERILSAYHFKETPRSYIQTQARFVPTMKTNLLILVRSRSAALHVLATALDEALVREIHKLPLPPSLLDQHETLLNPIFITEADMAQHKGYAMLVSSALVPPLTIWRRDEAKYQPQKAVFSR